MAGVLVAAGLVRAVDTLPGPVAATVTEVVDGDTIGVRARIWLGQSIAVRVRVAGIDAPELRGACALETAMARRARDEVTRRALGQDVQLWEIAYDKYGGRVVARVTLPDGADLAGALLEAGLARPYAGAARQPWCPVPAAAGG